MHLTIRAYSTALFSTWYFVEELGILFDAGDGVISALLQKSRKIDHVFISHADRDHVTGLLQFNQLNARPGFPKIFYPTDSGSFLALETFSKNFDPHVSGTVWQGMKPGESVNIKDDLFVQAIRNEHVPVGADVYKSQGYQVYEMKSKLKAEFRDLPQDKIFELIKAHGKEHMTEQLRTNLLTYSGDTPVDDYEKWNNTKILIHEATFLDAADMDSHNTKRNKHSSLPEVLKMVTELNIETLILGHFSSRYDNQEINARIRSLCKELNIKIPVYSVLPGQVYKNILAGQTAN
jgi:ribonuclease Z